jgi:hypothetical protein
MITGGDLLKAGSLKMKTALEYSTRVVQEGGRRCKKNTLNDLVHLTPLRTLMNPPLFLFHGGCTVIIPGAESERGCRNRLKERNKQSQKLKFRYGARNRFQEPSLELCSQAT